MESKKVKVIYKLSQKGQKDAFLKGISSSREQTFAVDYQDYMENIIYINDEGECILDVSGIIYGFIFVGGRVEELLDKEFDETLNEQELLKWIEDQVTSLEARKQKAIANNKRAQIKIWTITNVILFVVAILIMICIGANISFKMVLNLIAASIILTMCLWCTCHSIPK
ncbi:hypothetical protein IAI10_16250 [Clostridium sp. 19966]|uniref:hypothetical protein n=1 Tax=Clostridium sp. 19966 TaxID=2768166 RepID=UPI0028DE3B94|nr:hypothetical protein [Clostridium sp. 19966]MDT8718219.1 hypothetical protein [Clostridium sp. 19966]